MHAVRQACGINNNSNYNTKKEEEKKKKMSTTTQRRLRRREGRGEGMLVFQSRERLNCIIGAQQAGMEWRWRDTGGEASSHEEKTRGEVKKPWL